MSEAMDPVQQRGMEFFAMMLPKEGAKRQAPAAEDEGAAQKYTRPNEKGGQGRGGGKGRDHKDRKQDKSADHKWDSWGWGQGDGGNHNGKRVTALEQQVSLLTRLTLRHGDAVNLTRCEVSVVIHAKLGIDAGVVPQLFRVQSTWRELKKNSPEKLDESMRSTLVLSLFREILNRVEKLAQRGSLQPTTGFRRMVSFGLFCSTRPRRSCWFLKRKSRAFTRTPWSST